MRGLLALVLVTGCAASDPPVPEQRHFLSDPDGDGVMNEEACLPEDCLSLPNPDPACVYLEILETTFTTVDADGTILAVEATLCLTCLDAALEPVYMDCGGTLPPPEVP